MTLILSNNHRTATMVARGAGLKAGDWRFVSGPEDFRGRRNYEILLYIYAEVTNPSQDRKLGALLYEADLARERGDATIRLVKEEELVP